MSVVHDFPLDLDTSISKLQSIFYNVVFRFNFYQLNKSIYYLFFTHWIITIVLSVRQSLDWSVDLLFYW